MRIIQAKELVLFFLNIFCCCVFSQNINSHENHENQSVFELIDKKLVLLNQSHNLKKEEILFIFNKYTSMEKSTDIDGVISMFSTNDPYLDFLKPEDAKKRWIEIASRVKSYEVLGFLVNLDSDTPTDVVYLTEMDKTGRFVSILSVRQEDGQLKIISNNSTPDSPIYKIINWWSANYPHVPQVVTTQSSRKYLAVNSVDTNNKYTTILVCIASLLIIGLILWKVRKK